jgi:dethiobiotin synthetase
MRLRTSRSAIDRAEPYHEIPLFSNPMTAVGRTLLILGTARGVGKTLIARGILERIRSLGHRSIGIVPIETGCTHGENHDLIARDGALLRASSSGPVPPLVTSPYRFAAETSPAEAAAMSGLELGLDDLAAVIDAAADFGTLVIVEGPHSWATPLVEGKQTIDLAVHLSAPVLIVGRADAPDDAQGLVEMCRARGVQIAGGILSAVSGGATSLEGFFPTLPHDPSLDAVKHHLEAHRIVESLIEALRPS